MAAAHVQTAGSAGTVAVTSALLSFSSGVTGGNLLLVVVVGSSVISPPTYTVTDSAGNAYSAIPIRQVQGNLALDFFYCQNCSGGSVTVTVTPSVLSTISLAITEYSPSAGNQLTPSGNASGTRVASSTSLSLAQPGSGSRLVHAFAGTLGNLGNFAWLGNPSYTQRYNSGNVTGANDIDVHSNVSSPGSATFNWQVLFAGTIAAIATEFTELPIESPPTRQASQVLITLPDYWQEWDAYKQRPYSQWYVPEKPTTRQLSQRHDLLPDLNDQWWRIHDTWPVPVGYAPTPPPTRQASQILISLVDDWQEWSAYSHGLAVNFFVPLPPPTRQKSQRFDPLPDHSYLWWEQFRLWPVPVTRLPDPPATKQLSQCWDALPVLDYSWWEQFRTQPLPSGILTSQEGLSRIYNQIIIPGHAGNYHIQNDIGGYNVYVGTDALPDLTQPPTLYSATLPISIPVTPPGSGTKTLFVLVTKQDTYGLQSLNQHYSVFTIDSSGNLVLPAIPEPQGLNLYQRESGAIQVLCTYATVLTDANPATSWKVWAGTVPPNPAVDTPVAIVTVSGKVLTTSIGPFPAGLVYVTVGLFRTADGSLSPTVSGSITIVAIPGEVTAVPSGWNQP